MKLYGKLEENLKKESSKEEETSCVFCIRKGRRTEAECLCNGIGVISITKNKYNLGEPSCAKCKEKKEKLHDTAELLKKGLFSPHVEARLQDRAKRSPTTKNILKDMRKERRHSLRVLKEKALSRMSLTPKEKRTPEMEADLKSKWIGFPSPEEKVEEVKYLEDKRSKAFIWPSVKKCNSFTLVKDMFTFEDKKPKSKFITKSKSFKIPQISKQIQHSLHQFFHSYFQLQQIQKYSQSVIYQNQRQFVNPKSLYQNCVNQGSLIISFSYNQIQFGAFTALGWMEGIQKVKDKDSGGFIYYNNKLQLFKFKFDEVKSTTDSPISFGRNHSEFIFNFQEPEKSLFLFDQKRILEDYTEIEEKLQNWPTQFVDLTIFNNIFL
jgi:hypothetical protein